MNRLVKYSTLIATFLIYIGYLKQKFYFDRFDVKINDYLDITEIITSFLDDLNIIFIVLIISLFHMVLGLSAYTWTINKSRTNKKDIEVISRFFESIYKNRTSIILTVILSLLFILVGYFLFTKYLYIAGLYLMVLFSFQLFVVVFELINFDKIFDKSGNISLGISIIIVFTALSFFLAERDFRLLKNDESLYTIETPKEKIHISSSDLYIGKTKDYTFVLCGSKLKVIRNSNILILEKHK